MSYEDVNLNFSSLPCYNSKWQLEEKLTKFICRKFQYRAQRKTSKMPSSLSDEHNSLKLKFVETKLGTGSNTSQTKLC